MFDNYPIDAIADIVEVLEWVEANPGGKWFPWNPRPGQLDYPPSEVQRAKLAALPVMPEKVFAKYRQWQDVIRHEQLFDETGTMVTVPGLSGFGRIFLLKNRPKQKTKESSQSPSPSHVDGPTPPNLFYWKGKLHQIPPLAWRLLDFLWEKDAAQEEDVSAAVWQEQGSDPALKSALHDLNSALAKIGVPLQYGRQRGYIVKK